MMVTIRKGFRQTLNTFEGTAIIEDGHLVFLDRHHGVVYEGRNDGFKVYSLQVPVGTMVMEFAREPDGTELVIVRRAGGPADAAVMGFSSFKAAQQWVNATFLQSRQPCGVNPQPAAA
jgi:hypothetical protein